MKADRPKQFLELQGRPVLAHSLELLLQVWPGLPRAGARSSVAHTGLL